MVTKLYYSNIFQSNPGLIPEDSEKAYEVISKLHKKYKNKIIADLKDKSEKFVISVVLLVVADTLNAVIVAVTVIKIITLINFNKL